jgi:hypothetical protein
MTTPALSRAVRGKGRHYEDPRTGELLPSVTNVIGALNKPALPRWAAKVVAEQAVALAGSLAQLDPAEAIDLLKGSPWRSSSRAADRGTTIHERLEQLTLGREPDTELTGEALEFKGGIDAFLKAHDVRPWHTEVTMFGDGYAGTADFLGTIDDVPVIMDYKTGKDLYPEVALQLSALRYADVMVVDGEVRDVPPTDHGVAVLITRSGYKIAKVEDPAGAMLAFEALLAVRNWQLEEGDVLGEWPFTKEAP